MAPTPEAPPVADNTPSAYSIELRVDTPCTRTTLDVDNVAEEAVPRESVPQEAVLQEAVPGEAVPGDSTETAEPAVGVRSIPPAPTSHVLASSHRLVVLHDTGNEKANARLCDAYDMDPEFFAAHADGRRYQRLGWRCSRPGSNVALLGYATYTYPQILNLRVFKWFDKAGVISKDPERLPREGKRGQQCDGPVAAFCRASLWETAHTSVLLLNECPSSTTLEDVLLDTLDDVVHTKASSIAAGMVHRVVAQLVHAQWLDLFETVSRNDSIGSRRQPRRVPMNKSMYQEMACALEQNLMTARLHYKATRHSLRQHAWSAAEHNGGNDAMPPTEPPPAYELVDTVDADDWRELIARLGRMVALLGFHQMKAAQPPTESTESATNTTRLVPAGKIDTTVPGAIPEAKNALTRVTYMGGILLPFTVIAGIMSMSDPYGPGSSQFWIYWAVTLPVTFLTLTIIYADDIRNMYAWKELSPKRLKEAVKKGEVIPASAMKKTDADHDKPLIDDSEIETWPNVTLVRHGIVRRGSFLGRVNFLVCKNKQSHKAVFYRLGDLQSPPPESNTVVDDSVIATTSVSDASVEPDIHVCAVGHTSKRKLRRRPFLWQPIGLNNKMEIPMESFDADRNHYSYPPGQNIAAPGHPPIVVREDGKIYRSQRLGWGGALKKMVGF